MTGHKTLSFLLLTASMTICAICFASERDANKSVSYQQRSITLEAAQALANHVSQVCSEAGFSTVVTVVDSYGLLKTALVSDGSFPHAIETSLRKARTAASRRMPSGEVVDRNDHEDALGDVFHAIGLTSLGGGLPIIENGIVIGGVAVAGAPGENSDGQDYDLMCVRAGLDAIGLKI